jgi:hypothetical protein
MILQESQAASCMHFQYQNRRFKVFEAAGYWKDFQNLQVISKKQAKTLSFIFLTTKKQKIVKTVSACLESTYLFLKSLKKYSSRDTVLFTKAGERNDNFKL